MIVSFGLLFFALVSRLSSQLLRTKPQRKPMLTKSISLFRSTRSSSSSVAIVFLLADFGIRCLCPITSSFVSLSSVVQEMKRRNGDTCYCAAGLKAMMKEKQHAFFVFFNYNRNKSARGKPQGSRTYHFSDGLEYLSLSLSIRGQTDHRRHLRARPSIGWNLAMNPMRVLSHRYWSDWHRHVNCEGRKNEDDCQISTDKLFWHCACRSLDKGEEEARHRNRLAYGLDLFLILNIWQTVNNEEWIVFVELVWD